MDLTPTIDGTGPARLLDMVAGRSAAVFRSWLDAKDANFRSRVKVVAMDGFAGYRTATADALPGARAVMDPFHVVHLVAEKLTLCRQRIQQDICGHRGRSGDPLYGIRRILLTRTDLLTDKQQAKLTKALAAHDAHAALEVTACYYQDLIAAYANPDRRAGKLTMFKCLKRIRAGLPNGLEEFAQLGRSLWRRSGDPGLLRCRRVQRTRGGHQRPLGAPTRDRPGVPQPQPLHPAIPDPLRPTSRPDQRTLKPEEPLTSIFHRT